MLAMTLSDLETKKVTSQIVRYVISAMQGARGTNNTLDRPERQEVDCLYYQCLLWFYNAFKTFAVAR